MGAVREHACRSGLISWERQIVLALAGPVQMGCKEKCNRVLSLAKKWCTKPWLGRDCAGLLAYLIGQCRRVFQYCLLMLRRLGARRKPFFFCFLRVVGLVAQPGEGLSAEEAILLSCRRPTVRRVSTSPPKSGWRGSCMGAVVRGTRPRVCCQLLETGNKHHRVCFAFPFHGVLASLYSL